MKPKVYPKVVLAICSGVDFQLLDGKHGLPLKLTVQETFPTGKYQRLKASSKGTDAFGIWDPMQH